MEIHNLKGNRTGLMRFRGRKGKGETMQFYYDLKNQFNNLK